MKAEKDVVKMLGKLVLSPKGEVIGVYPRRIQLRVEFLSVIGKWIE